MNKRIIIFNGPPRSGKDTCVDYLWSLPGYDAMRLKLSQPLKASVQTLFRLSDAAMSYLEQHKDEPTEYLLGYTFREMQIKISEEWMKPTFGADVFGKLAAGAVVSARQPLVLCSDGGFIEELVPLHTLVGHERMLVVQIHRPGFDFSGDSRSYVVHPDVRGKTVSIMNDQGKQHLLDTVKVLVDAWLGIDQQEEDDE